MKECRITADEAARLTGMTRQKLAATARRNLGSEFFVLDNGVKVYAKRQGCLWYYGIYGYGTNRRDVNDVLTSLGR